jgi:hypothetical protein
MRKIVFIALSFAGALAFGADSHLKPGLWEMHVIKQVMDGKDQTAQLSGMAAQMQQTMANLPADQRARVEAMIKSRIGNDGAIRICISPEMAKRDTPLVDKEGRCQPASVQRSGDHLSYEINCTLNGTTTKGRGEATYSADLISSRNDITVTSAGGGTHAMQTESEMRFLGNDCGDVKPFTPPAGH